MKIKVIYHVMPWEIDYALLTFTQLKKSKYYLSDDVDITIDSVLNLSSYIINWEESQLPKEFFIDKYNAYSLLLKDYNHNKKIYDGNELYGHLDNHRESIGDYDYYITVAPDMYFSEHLLKYLIESTKLVKEEHFVVSPQIYKMWDNTWDILVNPIYKDVKYEDWDKVDLFDIRNDSKQIPTDILLNKVPYTQIPNGLILPGRWAGWFEIYSKSMFEKIAPIPKEWKGYGPWDFYGQLLIGNAYARGINIGFQQYALQGQTIYEYSVGPLKTQKIAGPGPWLQDHYKKYIKKNNIPDQRKYIEDNYFANHDWLNKQVNKLKQWKNTFTEGN